MMNIEIRLATKEDDDLIWIDHTKGSAINTCPMWGMVRYVEGKTPTAEGRNLALEAGSVCHEVFAAARFASLFEGEHKDFAIDKAIQQFGRDRFDTMHVASRNGNTAAERISNFSLEAIATSGYYDDPRDKRRTIQNIEDACRYYLQHYNYEAWMPYVDEEAGFIGIEVPIDLCIRYDGGAFKFVGKIDAIIDNKSNGEIEVHENKTGSRINDAWAMSFHMSHQVTGYIVASRLIIPQGKGRDTSVALLHGLQIPLPRNVEIGGVVAERVTRTDENIERWFKWLIDVHKTIIRYKDNIYESPMYTHSCNRYFQPCMLIPFCVSSKDDQEIMLEKEFRLDMWNPLSKEVA
jgi:hypothetical protein